MEYLHGIPIIHRDLSARNVLVGSDLNCKIVDFGMAKLSDNHSTKCKDDLNALKNFMKILNQEIYI